MRKIVVILFFSFSFLSYSQNYIAGNVYYGIDSLIEYRCGNLPIILSAPHGGYLTPASLPDRNCVGCVYVRDVNTQELTRQIESSLIFKTGCYPHVIINRLRRTKLDANRDMIEATDSNSITEPYWHDYMNYIDSARNLVNKKYQKGLFLDIHGHGHTISRLELGYLLSGTDLRKSDSLLNSPPLNSKSSILNLKFGNINSYSHAELIRGQTSFGEMIQRRGYPAVPSYSIPTPLLGEPYFSGGYNTKRFGSNGGGTIDAIQIEHNWDAHKTFTKRVEYADSLAETILEYLEKHYFINFSQAYCSTVSLEEMNKIEIITVYPNPTTDLIYLKGISSDSKIDLFSMDGKQISSFKYSKKIDLSNFNSGIYLLRISSETRVKSIKIIKN